VVAAGLAVLYATNTPNPQGDPRFFHEAGNLIAGGHGYIRPAPFMAHGREVATALHPPLYPLLVAAVSVLGVTDYTAQRAVVGGLLAAAIAIAAGLLGRRVGGPRAGAIAATLAALLPSLVAASGSGESEPLFGVIMLGALLLGYRMVERPTFAAASAAGALIGLAILTRSEGAILLAILPIVAWRGRASPANWRRLAAALVVCAVVVSPWLIRNSRAVGSPVISTNLGSLVAGANCPATYYGGHVGDWLHCYAPLQPGPTSRDEARWSSELVTRGLTYARHHAGRVPFVVLTRVMTTWSLGSLPSWNLPFGMSPSFRWIAIGAYFPILVLGIIGAAVLRRRGTTIALLLVPVVLTTLIAATGWGSTRFRYTGELVLVVLAAITLDWLASRWGRGAGKSVGQAG
jgi:4-amino-4-deoxy-L-arabinose transferase-like glycosyltransferase